MTSRCLPELMRNDGVVTDIVPAYSGASVREGRFAGARLAAKEYSTTIHCDARRMDGRGIARRDVRIGSALQEEVPEVSEMMECCAGYCDLRTIT